MLNEFHHWYYSISSVLKVIPDRNLAGKYKNMR